MNETTATAKCLNCERDDTQLPLVGLRYAGRQAWICTECLPAAIHHRHQLAGRLEQLATGPQE